MQITLKETFPVNFRIRRAIYCGKAQYAELKTVHYMDRIMYAAAAANYFNSFIMLRTWDLKKCTDNINE